MYPATGRCPGSSPRSASSISVRRPRQILTTRFGTLDGVMAATEEDLAGVTGIGPKIAESIATWFALDSNREFVEKLRRVGVDFGVAPAVEPDVPPVLEGKAVVVSGTLAGFTRATRRRRRSSPAAAPARAA